MLFDVLVEMWFCCLFGCVDVVDYLFLVYLFVLVY